MDETKKSSYKCRSPKPLLAQVQGQAMRLPAHLIHTYIHSQLRQGIKLKLTALWVRAMRIPSPLPELWQASGTQYRLRGTTVECSVWSKQQGITGEWWPVIHVQLHVPCWSSSLMYRVSMCARAMLPTLHIGRFYSLFFLLDTSPVSSFSDVHFHSSLPLSVPNTLSVFWWCTCMYKVLSVRLPVLLLTKWVCKARWHACLKKKAIIAIEKYP